MNPHRVEMPHLTVGGLAMRVVAVIERVPDLTPDPLPPMNPPDPDLPDLVPNPDVPRPVYNPEPDPEQPQAVI
jgi:hypothetical protein